MGIRRFFVLLLLLAAPCAAFALTLEEIQQELLKTLDRLAVLKQELQMVEKTKPSLPSNVPCLSLSRTLRRGMQGQDVEKLQKFLIAAGLLGERYATGYFGALTEAAVQQWQVVAGIVLSGSPESTGFGIVGPKTRASILAACNRRTAQGDTSQSSKCPLAPPRPALDACAGEWQAGHDAGGCLTGYQCSAAIHATSTIGASSSPPSIAVRAPLSGSVVTGGNVLTIRWESSNVSSNGSVSLSLIDANQNVVGDIARDLALSGTYLWRVPQGSTDCSEGESAFECIEKFARCEGGTSICAVEPGTYTIRIALSNLESSSGAFQIAGSSITDLLKSLLGAPIVAPPPPTSNGPTVSSGANSCVHEGGTFAEGTTLSVPCSGSNCPSGGGTGFIAGTCTGGKWCIPFTAYCASSFAAIDVSAYEGGGGAGIEDAQKSVYTSGCPQEGWRAYLTCTIGSCTTGWHICRGGVWVLDSVQETVAVGTQGPCATGQVWCGIGTGFGCVVAAQCVNGNAL